MIKLKALFIYFLVIVKIISQDFSTGAINSYIDEIPSSTNFGIMIYDPLSADTLFAKNSDASLIPASNIKLFTTATAIDLLGKDYRLKTVIGSTDSNFTDGSIDGDLILKGFGNSLFTEEDLDSLVNVLVNLGIKQINGNVYGDDTFFDNIYSRDDWIVDEKANVSLLFDNIYSRDDWIVDEKANVSLPPVSALILDRNGFIVSVDADKAPGSKVGYSLKPDIDFYEVDNSAKVVKFRRTPRVSSRFLENKISVRVSGGARQRKFPYSYILYADNPTLYAAYTLYDKLIKNEITISGTAGTLTEETNFFDIAESSTSLSEIIPLINKNSDNFLAECLFKTLGAYYSGKIGNSFYATQAVMNFLEENEIPEFYELSIVDGSGISRFNEVTASSITNLLEKIYLNVEKYEFFKNSLSIAGMDGTLDRRFRRSKLRNNFFGKTGTLNGVTSLSGYLETKSGKDLIVSFLMQFKEKGSRYHKDIQDKILEYLWTNY